MIAILALAAVLSTPPPQTYETAATAAQLCVTGYARRHRHVTYATRDRVYNRAGLPRHHRAGWLIDHRIPLEIGGTNDEANLFAQTRGEARRKDGDENAAREAICTDRMTPAAARVWIWQKWAR